MWASSETVKCDRASSPVVAFWPTVERWLLDLQRDPERGARYARLAYWISLGFMLLGFVVILAQLRRKGVL